MQILAIDPGSTASGYVYYDCSNRQVVDHGKFPNETVEREIAASTAEELVMEYPSPRGQPMYTQLVDAIRWIGRFEKTWNQKWHRMDRKDVKMMLCRSAKANDSMIRAAIISRYPATGDGKVGQIGTVKQPGPLFGVSKDKWAALAVAITWSIQHGYEPDTITNL